MKRELVEILVCPVCRGELTLSVEKEEAGEVETGLLQCAACGISYPVTDGIPHLLSTGRVYPGR